MRVTTVLLLIGALLGSLCQTASAAPAPARTGARAAVTTSAVDAAWERGTVPERGSGGYGGTGGVRAGGGVSADRARSDVASVTRKQKYRNNRNKRRSSSRFFGSVLFWILMPLILLVVLVLWLVLRLRRG